MHPTPLVQSGLVTLERHTNKAGTDGFDSWYGAVVATVFSLSINCWGWKSCFWVCQGDGSGCVTHMHQVEQREEESVWKSGMPRISALHKDCLSSPFMRHCLGCSEISVQTKEGSLGIEAILGYKIWCLQRRSSWKELLLEVKWTYNWNWGKMMWWECEPNQEYINICLYIYIYR